MTAAIAITDLTVTYGRFVAVDEVHLEVERGEVFGFLGPNGAGKTSTIRVLLDLLRPASGRVEVLGADVRAGGGALRRRVGFLPGDLALFPHLTGTETLDLFARLVSARPVLREEVLGRLGFPMDALTRRIRSYSTGMRQMIGITSAFQHAPELLVLDEPTTGLDPFVREAFLGLVRSMPRRGATVFLSSHVLAEIEVCADRVGLIDEGRLVLVETIDEMRSTRPRRIVLRYEDGRVERSTHQGDPADLLRGIPTEGLVDVEIRPAGLEEVVRAAVRGRGSAP